jgi:hypothetical protein
MEENTPFLSSNQRAQDSRQASISRKENMTIKIQLLSLVGYSIHQ